MSSLLRKYWYLTAVALLVFASASSFAQTTTVANANVGNATVVGNVYVDPYTATVGGVNSTYVICDDWSDNTYIGESWTANVGTIGSTLTGTPLFGNQPQVYAEAAWLATQLLANPTNQTLQAEISFAIWELTYPYAPHPESPGPTAYLAGLTASGIPGLTASAIQSAISGTPSSIGLLAQANAAVNGGYTGSGWEILTPVVGTPGPPQEFLVYTPESSAVILFGADMLGLAALAFFFRRRLVQTEI